MADQNKRAWVAAMYPGPKWKKRVAKMSDAQVAAIYLKEMHKPKPPKKKESPGASDETTPF